MRQDRTFDSPLILLRTWASKHLLFLFSRWGGGNHEGGQPGDETKQINILFFFCWGQGVAKLCKS